MSLPPLERLHLVGRRSIDVCSCCGFVPPRHNYYCPGAELYTRSQILREMIRCQDDERTWLAVSGDRGQRQSWLARDEFWRWAELARVDFWDADQRAAVLEEVDRERRRMVPPWKRRTTTRHPSATSSSARGSRP